MNPIDNSRNAYPTNYSIGPTENQRNLQRNVVVLATVDGLPSRIPARTTAFQSGIQASRNPSLGTARCGANIIFDEGVPDELKGVVDYVVAGVGEIFPLDHMVFISAILGQEEEANTQVDPKMAMLVFSILSTAGDVEVSKARYAVSLMHELHLHAAPNLYSHETGGVPGSVQREHFGMHTPAGIGNHYFMTAVSVMQHLPADIKSHFIKEFVLDVVNQLQATVAVYGSEQLQKEIEWVNLLHSLKNDPDHSIWTPNFVANRG